MGLPCYSFLIAKPTRTVGQSLGQNIVCVGGGEADDLPKSNIDLGLEIYILSLHSLSAFKHR